MRRAKAEMYIEQLRATGLTLILNYDGPRGYGIYGFEQDGGSWITPIHTPTAARELLRKRKPRRTHANRDKAEARP